MRLLLGACATVVALQLAGPAFAQQGQPAGVDPTTLQAAREVVRKAQGDRAVVLSAMAAPMIGLTQ